MGYDVFEKLCEQRGITPYRVSKETGVSTAALSSWKTGRYAPKTDKLQLIADYFGVSMEYLMTGEEPRFYEDDETAQLAQKILTSPDLRALMQAAEDSTPEDMQMVADILKRMKATNPDG